jgi:type IV pilus assembly protein PilB
MADTGSVEAAELRPLLPALGEAHGGRRIQLGSILVRDGLLSSEQLEEALAEKEQNGHRIGEIVVQRGWVPAAALARALAEQHHLDYVDLHKTRVEAAATGLLPEHFARRYEALPIRFVSNDVVLVAVADPTNVVASDDLRLALGTNVRLGVAAAPDLEEAIDRAYRAQLDLDDPELADSDAIPLEELRAESVGGAPAVRLVNTLIAQAIEERASDLHFEPQATDMVVRTRVDGVMRRMTTISKSMQPAVSSRLKIMGELDIAEKRAPQDGRITLRVDGHSMDLRVAVLPTTHGEQIVLRIMNRAGNRLGLQQLGMSPEAEAAFACGPTGSGKTTTLYAALDMLNDDDRVLTTIEDPVEYQTPGINQIEVNPKSGLTFSRGLRTILRSDPDVLLVGEIRDEETARIAIQAAMTGHLVLTTLHTHNVASSIARLVDMGVEPGLLATSINCIVAQRLARRLCLQCREAYWPDAQERTELGLTAEDSETFLYRAVGCIQCAGTGYSGRVALYEVMEMKGKVRTLIGSGSTDEIFAAAVGQGMKTLRQDGMRLCLAGISSLDEVRRVTGDGMV